MGLDNGRKNEGLKSEINRGSTEKRQDSIFHNVITSTEMSMAHVAFSARNANLLRHMTSKLGPDCQMSLKQNVTVKKGIFLQFKKGFSNNFARIESDSFGFRSRPKTKTDQTIRLDPCEVICLIISLFLNTF